MSGSRPPRVLICARPGIGGAGRVIETLLRRLPEHGVTGTAALSALEGDRVLEVAHAHGWAVERLDLRREISPLRDAQAGLRLRRLARGHDLVHAHAAKAGALARLALPLRKGVPVVYSPHGFYFTYHDEGSPAWRRYLGLEQRLAPRTTLLHCVGAAERETALHHRLATAESCHVLPNPVPPDPVPPDPVPPNPVPPNPVPPAEEVAVEGLPERDSARPLVVMAARLEHPKDPLTFVQSAGLIPAELGARFALVGEGSLLAAAREAAPDDGRVTFLPEGTPVRALLRRASLAVLATHSEALPLFLLEALAEGVPIVASDIAGCRDAAADAALYIAAGDASALGAAITRTLREPALHRSLAAAARARAPLFTEERWIEGLLAMYARVLPGHAAAAPA